MHFFKRLLCIGLMALTLIPKLNAEDLFFTIEEQKYAVIPDTTAMTFYCSVPEKSLPAQVGILSSANMYTWADEGVGALITLNNCTQEHAVRSARDGAVWKVVFTTLPVVTLTVEGESEPGSEEVPMRFQVFDPLRYPGKAYAFDCLGHYRGSYSLLFDKKSWSIDIIDRQTGENLEPSFFGIRATDAWILDAMAVDVSRLRNRLCFDLWNTVSTCPWSGERNGTKGQYVELIYNGRYHGLYCFTDKVKRKTLGLKKTPEGAPNGLHGLLYKGLSGTWNWALCLQWYNPEPTDSMVWNRYELRYPNNTVGDLVWSPLQQLIRVCSTIDDSNTPENFEANWQRLFYEDNFYDFALILMVLNLTDNGMYNSFLAAHDYETDPRMLMIPWDMDGSLGRNPNGLIDSSNRGWGQVEYLGPYNRMMLNWPKIFGDMLNSRWERWKKADFSVDAFDRRLYAYADLFARSGAWKREYERWGTMMKENNLDFAPTPYEEADYISGWYSEQVAYLDALLQKGLTEINDVALPTANGENAPVYTLQGQYLGRYADVWKRLSLGIYLVGTRKCIKTNY